MGNHKGMAEFLPLNIAVLTVSDSRGLNEDSSGQLLADRVAESGHRLADRKIVRDDIYQIRAVISDWIAREDVDAVVVTGGTGFTERDNTPQAITPLFDREADGFGEMFRQVSLKTIGSSTIQSRAFGGMANSTVIFCMPGSPNACRTGWDEIIVEQLDSRHRPCNFVPHLNIKQPDVTPARTDSEAEALDQATCGGART